jgi:hypothetical protein
MKNPWRAKRVGTFRLKPPRKTSGSPKVLQSFHRSAVEARLPKQTNEKSRTSEASRDFSIEAPRRTSGSPKVLQSFHRSAAEARLPKQTNEKSRTSEASRDFSFEAPS